MPFDLPDIIDPRIGFLAVASYLGCFVLLGLAQVFPRLKGRAEDDNAVQATHSGLTPRIGGVAIFGTLALGVLFAPTTMMQNYFEIIFATTILFLVGLREDLGYPVSPRNRLLTVVGVSLLVIVLIGEWLPRMGVPYIDSALQIWLLGVPFTLFVTAGVANGFNLIDGVNGLASLTAMTAGLALAAIAYQAQYPPRGDPGADDSGFGFWVLFDKFSLWLDVFGRCGCLYGRLCVVLVRDRNHHQQLASVALGSPADIVLALGRYDARDIPPQRGDPRGDAPRPFALPPTGHARIGDRVAGAPPPKSSKSADDGDPRALRDCATGCWRPALGRECGGVFCRNRILGALFWMLSPADWLHTSKPATVPQRRLIQG